MFIHPDERAIIDATPALADLAKRLKQNDEWRAAYAKEIEQARDEYAMGSCDNLEIDDEPSLSPADDGVWVSAWVWVANGDEEDES